MAGKHRRTKASDDSSSDDDHEIAKKLRKISHVKREIQKKQEKTYKTLKNVCDEDSGSEEKKVKDRPFMTYLPSSTAKMFSISDSSSDSTLNSSKKVEKESPKNKKSIKVREKVSTSDSDMETVKEIHKKRVHSPVKRTSEQKMSYRKKRESDSSSSKEFQKTKRKQISEVDDAGTSLGEYTIIETPIKSEVANVKVNKKQEVKLKNSTLEVIEQLQKIVEGLLSELESQSNYFMDKDIKVVGDANFIPHKIFQTYKSAFYKIKKNRNDFNSIYKSWVDSCCESSNSAVNKRFSKPFICNKSDSSVSDSYVLETVTKNLNKTKHKLSPKISNESEDSDNSKKKLKKNLSITKISESKVERSKVNKACKTTDDESNESNSSEEKQIETGVKTNQDKKFNLSLTKSDSEQSHKSNLKSCVRRNSIENKSITLSKGINEDKPNKSNSVSKYSLSPVSDCDVDKIFSEEESSCRVSRKSISTHSSKEEESLTLTLSKEINEDEPINPVNDIRQIVTNDSDKESSCGKSQANKNVAMEGDTKGNEEKVKGLNDLMNKLYSKSASTSDEDLFDESTVSEVPNTPTKSPILSKTKGFKKTLLASQTSSAPSVIENEPVVTNTPKSPILTKTKRFKKILLASQTSSASSVTENESMGGKETEVEAVIPEEAETEAKAAEPKESNVQAKTVAEKTSEIDVISGTKIASKKEINDIVAEDVELAAMENLLQDCDSDQSVNSSCSTLIVVANTSIPKELQKETEQTPRKQKKLVRKQTKKHNSVSSDSSEESMDEREGRTSRQKANGNASRRASQRAFDLRKKMKADKKIFTDCRVTMERLSKTVLKKHARALAKSKKYVEKKKIHSMTNLDSLESKKKSKKSADNDNTTMTKAKKENKSKKNLGKDHSDEENDILSDNDSPSEVNDKDKSLLNESNSEQVLEKEIEEVAKQNLLKNSSDEEENVLEVEEPDTKKVKSLKIKIKNINNVEEIKITEKNGDEKMSENKKKDNWKKDKVLTFNMTDTDSDEEKLRKSLEKKKAKEEQKDASISEEIAEEFAKSTGKKKSKPRKRQRILDSDDSDANVEILDEDSSSKESESEEEKKEEKKKKGKKRKNSSDSEASSGEKKSKSKRKRIKKVVTDSESDDQESPSKGRKNIRKVLKDKHVADDTKKAAQDEEDRLKRIAERQRLFNEMYDARLAGEAKVDKLVLDIDEETKEELVVVDEELVKRLKPHQAQGIKFMWDACFESLKQIKKSEGSGCIIAHCMGLGKTFQVVTLSHTLLSHEETGVKTVMVVCPLSTVLNWVNEFKTWLKHVENSEEIEIYELTKLKKNTERKYMLESWQKTGGVLIIGYEMFRNLTSTGKKMRKAMQESIMRSLVDPGADLVVCDEGHLLKNEESALSKAMRLVRTLRRIVLTGTPLQNNLKEYHCMVQFVKPNLLGTKKEFLNRFVNPITNGQFDDSTPYDVKLMKKRAHVLHKMLEGCVQRFDYSVLTPFLPPKQEYVIFVRLTEVQIKMYQHYIDNFARRFGQRNGSLFADFQELQRIWTHPYVLRLNAEKVEKANEKKRLEASDSEGSLKDFIDDDSDSDVSNISSSSDNSNSDVQCIDSDKEKQPTRSTRSTRGNMKDEPEEIVPNQETAEEAAWWSKFIEEEHFEDLRISTKLVLLFGILRESEQIGDKVLVFSQSLYSLTLIEQFLNLIDQETQEGRELEHLDNHSGRWQLGLDYFRLDGSTSAENRSAWCKIFNNPNNTRARLFLISTRAGGLGINLTAANRVIIFDASWNPSHDVQSIFRIYRFGQKKPCYVYRFLAAGTMEEKIYNRQVTKLSLACRVVDEQQIERHYSNNDLAELYQFESYEGKSITLNLPKDRLLAEIFLKYKDAVYNYHEHDSLLENKEEEELDEEERKQAWLEYEEEKQGKRQMINPMMNNMGNNMLLNQMLMNVTSFPEFENIKLLIQKDYPNLPPEHLDTVARQAMYDMYRFVDQHAVSQLLNPFANRNPMQQNLLGAQPMTHQQQQYNQQNQLMNMLTQPQMNYTQPNHMPAYSGRGRPPKHLSMNNPMLAPMTMQQQQVQQAPMQQAQIQQPLIQQQQVQQPITDNNEVEIVSDRQVTPPNTDSASNADDKKAE